MPDYRAIARQKARKYGLDPDIFERQINQESGFAEDVITGRRRSSAGALGIAQFMPATAQGMGVDPLDPVDALDGAARLMAQHLKEFGNYEDALRAYNAGPGAVEASRSYDETNAYVAAILGGKDPGGLNRPSGVSGGGDVGSSEVSSPGQNPFPMIASIYQPDENNPYSDILQRGWDLLGQAWEQQYGGGELSKESERLPSIGEGGGGGGGKGLRGLHEAFYDPVGGYDEGQDIGPIGGHGTHAHFGGNPAAIRRIVNMAQRPKWGLTVREYAPVDPVDPVHTEGSWHGRFGGRGAADISGENLDAFFRRVLRRAGLR